MRTSKSPMLAPMTTQIHGSIFCLVGFSDRCPETLRKKIRNAANSRTAEIGNRSRHSHRYTLAVHRRAVPIVHIAQQAQARANEEFLAPRIFGME